MNQIEETRKIRVLVVDDSPVIRELITKIIEAQPDMQLVGTASNGEEAIAAVKEKNPDVVTMDLHMPKLDGLEATRKIMETHPVAIVIVSATISTQEAIDAFRVLDVGAVSVIGSLVGPSHPEYEAKTKELIQTLKTMSEIKVIRRWPKRDFPWPAKIANLPIETQFNLGEVKFVAIGASTGGPVVLKTILSSIPKNFPVSILIVQHIANGFTKGFVDWLRQVTNFPIKIADSGEIPQPGHAYVAPEGFQMEVTKIGTIMLSKSSPLNGHCPSVSALFKSIVKQFGKQSVGILLTGMGKDGAIELKLMKDQGAFTIVQDKETSVVNGMPGEAINIGAASVVLSPEGIASFLTKMSETIISWRKTREQ
ncbi:TPA: chemotaxis-specific protein-glutamate methyltransferase CheB [Legionella pneumophila]|nr:chemotaxis-specific protein-glutamate methyltransferase CheB [Legionella pneumophila]HAT1658440.1 chemotaxis-specific protein-glutamate methyltransferase CheB [Legionella pneumophila]HAT1660809.1 chemotaxis-specific protein-glutamate methyltransferase CheB [Legionella pneumophila]HAT1884046.1 chemotaxis-specific protein-glutamate methyltransferase CheB [Legionella pneumophila]HAT2115636.1 chemotaxis-specific protein-glutamate methyltransferase CheB [Legionella pneumophila]HAT8720481.1 chemo